jgi:hypothetical protein
MSQMTVCDWDSCGKVAVLSVTVLDEQEGFTAWIGAEADLCMTHAQKPFPKLLEQWEKEIQGR